MNLLRHRPTDVHKDARLAVHNTLDRFIDAHRRKASTRRNLTDAYARCLEDSHLATSERTRTGTISTLTSQMVNRDWKHLGDKVREDQEAQDEEDAARDAYHEAKLTWDTIRRTRRNGRRRPS